jgi:homoserine O-succinyltransferase
LSGVFDCHVVAEDHPLMSGLPSRWPSPHSRHFGLPEDALVANGYKLLSRSIEAGPDVFLKDGASCFVFLQGHPEYYGDTLLREYRRDVRRFLVGERDEYPSPPRWYFDTRIETALAGLRRHALRTPHDPTILIEMARLTGAGHSDPWHAAAVRFYANWLTHVVRGDLRSGTGGRLRSDIAERRLQHSPSNGGVVLSR